MKFADKNPPETKGMWNLNIESYYYYLSFLERFIEETKSIPTDLRKVYLVRAEYRYFQWAYCTKKSSSSLRNVVPPLGK